MAFTTLPASLRPRHAVGQSAVHATAQYCSLAPAPPSASGTKVRIPESTRRTFSATATSRRRDACAGRYFIAASALGTPEPAPDRSKLGPTDERFGPGVAMTVPEIEERLAGGKREGKMLALTALRDLQPVEEAVRLLCLALKDDVPTIRATAAFNMGAQLAFRHVPETIPRLLDALGLDPDYQVRASAAGALGYLQDGRALEGLVRAVFEDDEWLVQFSAATALGNLRDARALACLLDVLDRTGNDLVVQAAVGALGEIAAMEAVPRLMAFIDAPDPMVRQRLAEALGNLVCAASLEALQILARDDVANVREAAARSLAKLRTKDNLDVIMQQISESKSLDDEGVVFGLPNRPLQLSSVRRPPSTGPRPPPAPPGLGAAASGVDLARMLADEVARRRAEGGDLDTEGGADDGEGEGEGGEGPAA